MAGRNCGGAIFACRVIKIRAKRGEGGAFEILNARIAPFVYLAGAGEKWNANVIKFAIGEGRSQMAQVESPLADEQLQSMFGTSRVF